VTPMNPWLAAGIGLAQTAGVLAVMVAFGAALSGLARLVLRRPRDQWRVLRIDRFWLVNMALAPFMVGIFALLMWLFRLSPDAVGLNTHNLGLSLGVAIPVGLLLGLPSAIAAPIAAREGISPMNVPFGRSLFDVIGAIAYAAIFVGPLEEIPFRGIIQTLLDRAMPQSAHLGSFSILLGTVLAAFIFVFYHYRNVMLGGETRQQFVRLLPGRTIASFILALLFQGTGSLLGPIIFHNLVDTCTIASLSITLYRLRQQGKWPIKRPVPAAETPESQADVPQVPENGTDISDPADEAAKFV
jgi:membrane protease YdiL (CAAX protease family)